MARLLDELWVHVERTNPRVDLQHGRDIRHVEHLGEGLEAPTAESECTRRAQIHLCDVVVEPRRRIHNVGDSQTAAAGDWEPGRRTIERVSRRDRTARSEWH